MSSNKFVAIDLGSTGITAMAGEVQPDGYLKILGVESKPSDDVRYGMVEQSSGAAYKVSEVIRLLANSARLSSIDFISVSLCAKSMKNITVSVTKFVGASKTVSEKLIQEMLVDAEGKVLGENVAVYDVIPLYYELDGKRLDEPVGEQGMQITGKYNVVYGNTQIASKLESCIERTGKVIEFRCLGGDALGTAVLDEHEKEEGCILINLGGLTTSLTIFENGAIQQIAVVPMGGKTITKDIQEFGISESNAERLKCLAGKALESMIDTEIKIAVPSIDPEQPQENISNKMLAMAIEARLDEIMSPIFDTIEAYKGNIQHGIILTGGASQLKGLPEYITDRSGFSVRFGHFTDWLDEKTDSKFIKPEYAQLVGTILLNQEYRELHPLEEISKKADKKPKIRTGIKDRATGFMNNFFGDENKL